MIKLYFNTNIPAYPQNFMIALQFSVIAVGIGLTLRHPRSHKPILSITLACGKKSICLGINGCLL